jgi:uncharacterized protein
MIPEPLGRDGLARWMSRPLWGMVHLAPLPGSPEYAGSISAVVERAQEDALKLVEAGFRALVVENYGDLPFYRDHVPPVTAAGLTRVCARLRQDHPDLRLMVNCLRNDARTALSVATVCEADAIRVNVHTGAALTDQGVIEGDAGRTLRLRRNLGSGVRIFADVAVKHAAPLAARPLGIEASDLRVRGRADALLVTGSGTGAQADPDEVEQLRDGAPNTPIFVASGVNVENAPQWARLVDGAIVGSSLMNQGLAGHGVDRARARQFVETWMGASQSAASFPREEA